MKKKKLSSDDLFDAHQPDDLADPKLTARAARRKKRKKFKPVFVQFPTRWAAAMRQAKSSGTAYELALAILNRAFECKTRGHGEIVLSAAMKMPRNTRRRAAKELVEVGLIELRRERGNQAYKVRLMSRGPNRVP